jgi:hypothetical protein
MNTKFDKDCPAYVIDDSLIIDHKTDATTTITLEEVGDKTFGYGVSQIDVVRQDGSISRFWVTLKENNRGQVLCEVTACDIGKPQLRRKSIVGSWFKKRVEA